MHAPPSSLGSVKRKVAPPAIGGSQDRSWTFGDPLRYSAQLVGVFGLYTRSLAWSSRFCDLPGFVQTLSLPTAKDDKSSAPCTGSLGAATVGSSCCCCSRSAAPRPRGSLGNRSSRRLCVPRTLSELMT